MRKHFLIEEGMNRFQDSGLHAFADTVSYTESPPVEPPQRAYRAPRIDVLPWTHSWVWVRGFRPGIGNVHSLRIF